MTELTYLTDTYTFTGTATIVKTGTNEYGTYIILDRTIFYPQWGGQPSDHGTVSSESGIFHVDMVRLDEYGVVLHYGTYKDGELRAWMTVSTGIDAERRMLHARIHSAGHLMDIALRNIGIELTPTKGYHFSDWPYVEYYWTLVEPIESILPRLQAEIDHLIELDIPVIVTTDMSVQSPLGKTPRYVQFEGYTGCGCGGTPVRSSGEIGKVTIRKIKMKEGSLRVSYSVG